MHTTHTFLILGNIANTWKSNAILLNGSEVIRFGAAGICFPWDTMRLTLLMTAGQMTCSHLHLALEITMLKGSWWGWGE